MPSSTVQVQVNALLQCNQYQVFSVRAVTRCREAFSTNFSTYLLKTDRSAAEKFWQNFPITDFFTWICTETAHRLAMGF